MKNSFRSEIRKAIADPVLQEALDNNADRRRDAQFQALEGLPDSTELRERARKVRQEVIKNLDSYLGSFIAKAKRNGFIIHRAGDAAAARSIVLQIAEEQQALLVAKSKSMVSEEIHLNRALLEAGIKVVETDLGEFIIQLRGEHPAHIITPAIHLLKEQVGKTFQKELGAPYTTDVAEMTCTARKALRQAFLEADIGISGANFGVVETGTICLVTNEGNGRMVTTLPRVHIALMGMERLVPTLNDLALMLKLLPRSATGQKLTTYINFIQGPQKTGDPDGAPIRHLILIDNGRSELHRSPLQEALLCIRCGACLNACPVFREAGGHAYHSVYPGPIGSVISPGLFGIESYGHLAKASTLCGACRDACPVGIDFPTLLLRVRDQTMRATEGSSTMNVAMRIYSWVIRSSQRFELAQRLAGLGSRFLPRRDGWITHLPLMLAGWTDSRHFPSFHPKPLRARIEGSDLAPLQAAAKHGIMDRQETSRQTRRRIDPIKEFQDELEALNGVFKTCQRQNLAHVVLDTLRELGSKRILSWRLENGSYQFLAAELKRNGYELAHPHLSEEANQRKLQLAGLSAYEVGISGAVAGLADTGTVILPGGPDRSQLVSLLPFHHLAILPLHAIYPALEDWLADSGAAAIADSNQINLITGPSRTADIEMTLTIGVHGPGNFIVIGVEQDN